LIGRQDLSYSTADALFPQCVSENVKTFVIDAEAVAYDIKEQKLLPFQQLTTRKRKDVRTEDITVRVHIFAFDLLYLNGEVSLGMAFSADTLSDSPLCYV
jgi:ATP-dependent DNA ligase